MARVSLPKIDEMRADERTLTPDQIRSKMKEAGVVPHRPWNERPIMLMSTNDIMDEYVPPPSDGSHSLVDSVKSRGVDIKNKVARKMTALRRIRSYLPDFDFSDVISRVIRLSSTYMTVLLVRKRRSIGHLPESASADVRG